MPQPLSVPQTQFNIHTSETTVVHKSHRS